MPLARVVDSALSYGIGAEDFDRPNRLPLCARRGRAQNSHRLGDETHYRYTIMPTKAKSQC